MFILQKRLPGASEYAEMQHITRTSLLHHNDVTCCPTCGCLFLILHIGWYGLHEIELSKMGKNSGNSDLVCKKIDIFDTVKVHQPAL